MLKSGEEQSGTPISKNVLQQNQNRLGEHAEASGYKEKVSGSFFRTKKVDVPDSRTAFHRTDILAINTSGLSLKRVGEDGTAQYDVVTEGRESYRTDFRKTQITSDQARNLPPVASLAAQQTGEMIMSVTFSEKKQAVKKLLRKSKVVSSVGVHGVDISLSPLRVGEDHNPINISISGDGSVRLNVPRSAKPLDGQEKADAIDRLQSEFGINLPERVQNVMQFIDRTIADDSDNVLDPTLFK